MTRSTRVSAMRVAARHERTREQGGACAGSKPWRSGGGSNFALHPLKREMHGRWAISVNESWRVTFEFQDGNACVLDYEDYH